MSGGIQTRAWRGIGFEYPERIPTMLSAEERQYLYWLGRRVWSGRGCVVEIGPWLGGSTVCLAAGMRDSGHRARAALVVVDNFKWRAFMAARANLSLAPGASFEAQFRANIADYRELVDCRVRSLPDEPIEGDLEAEAKRSTPNERVPLFDGALDRPAEIVFIDGAKSWRGMRHLLRVLAGSLLPGRTLLVCQDFKYWGAYWVPVMMMRLSAYLQPVHGVCGATTLAFELVRRIPDDALEALEDHVAQLPTAETLAAIERARGLLAEAGDKAGACGVSLARVSFLAHQRRLSDAVAAFDEIQQRWPISVPSEPLERARAYLRDREQCPIARPARLRAAEAIRYHGRRIARLAAGPRPR